MFTDLQDLNVINEKSSSAQVAAVLLCKLSENETSLIIDSGLGKEREIIRIFINKDSNTQYCSRASLQDPSLRKKQIYMLQDIVKFDKLSCISFQEMTFSKNDLNDLISYITGSTGTPNFLSQKFAEKINELLNSQRFKMPSMW